jgi:WD40 repeat protein
VLWDVATGKQIGKPVADLGNTHMSLAFSQDARNLAVSGGDRVRLYQVTPLREIAAPFAINRNPDDLITSVAFSPDGGVLAVGASDGAVRLWDVAYLDDVVRRLCVTAGRSLSHAEWDRDVQDVPYQKICP